MLKYALVENVLANDPNNCVAVVSSPEVKDLNDVIGFMIAEGTGLTRPQAMAYFEKLTQTIEYFVGQGHRVITPLIHVRPSIKGLFNNMEDHFDSSRHRINIKSASGLRLKELATKIKLEKVDIIQQIPMIKTFVDGTTGSINYSASAGGIGVVRGRLLKFDTSDIQQGVFFTPENDPSDETRVEVYTGIRPSEIHFQIPQLPEGNYMLAVKTLSRNGNDLIKGELKQMIDLA